MCGVCYASGGLGLKMLGSSLSNDAQNQHTRISLVIIVHRTIDMTVASIAHSIARSISLSM